MVAGLRSQTVIILREACAMRALGETTGKKSEREYKKVDYAGSAGSSTRNAKEGEDKRIQRKQFHCASVGILSIALVNVELYRKYYYFGSLSLRIFLVILLVYNCKFMFICLLLFLYIFNI